MFFWIYILIIGILNRFSIEIRRRKAIQRMVCLRCKGTKIIRAYKDLIMVNKMSLSEEEWEKYFESLLEEDEKTLSKLQDEVVHICKVLNERNRTLFRVIYLRMAMVGFAGERLNPEDFEAKRGKKTVIPIKMVMKILQCSHRTAQDYVRFLKAFHTITEIIKLRDNLLSGRIMRDTYKRVKRR